MSHQNICAKDPSLKKLIYFEKTIRSKQFKLNKSDKLNCTSGCYRLNLRDSSRTISECGICNFVLTTSCLNNNSNNNNKCVYIQFIEIKKEYIGKGYGTMLLYEIFKDVYMDYGIEIVELLDNSSNFKKEHNIYIKMGLYYVSGAKMCGDLKHILFESLQQTCFDSQPQNQLQSQSLHNNNTFIRSKI